MKPDLPSCTKWAVVVTTIAALTAGCGKNDQTVHAKDVAMPGIAATKAIAEEGFIYGLPLVMNYAVMYEYAVDSKSSQFKAPFNQIKNETRVFTYEDTAVVTPNSDKVDRKTHLSSLLTGGATNKS